MLRNITLTVLMASAAVAGSFDSQVRDDFFAGFGGNAARFAAGMQKCEDLLAREPNEPEALVWHGAGLYFQAKLAFTKGDAKRGMELATRGQTEMDRAAGLAPNDLAVRIPRGAVYITATRSMPRSPGTVALLQRGIEDYETAFAKQKDSLAELTPHARGELLFGLAEGYLRLGDAAKARGYFEKLAAGQGDDHAAQARAWLESGQLTGATTCGGCHVRCAAAVGGAGLRPALGGSGTCPTLGLTMVIR